MARNLTEEKIKYLLFLYDRKTHPLSVTAAAKSCGVAKSTFSRTLSTFFEMGYVANPEKRCCPLTVRKRPVRSGRRLTR